MRAPLRYLLLTTLGGGLALGVTVATPSAAQSGPADQVNVGECQTCHETAFTEGFLHSRHAGVEASCESCHKGAAEHGKAMMEGVDAPAPSVKELKASALNETCLSCHEKGHSANWVGSVHERRGVACSDCHSVHQFRSAKSHLKTA
jgi:nitrate/TMAO reductase-like tetraheme cytochrome c subunit